jgi:hypothetical protein
MSWRASWIPVLTGSETAKHSSRIRPASVSENLTDNQLDAALPSSFLLKDVHLKCEIEIVYLAARFKVSPPRPQAPESLASLEQQ